MRARGLPAIAIVLAAVGSCAAQTITVDITPSHVKNTIIPNRITIVPDNITVSRGSG